MNALDDIDNLFADLDTSDDSAKVEDEFDFLNDIAVPQSSGSLEKKISFGDLDKLLISDDTPTTTKKDKANNDNKESYTADGDGMLLHL